MKMMREEEGGQREGRGGGEGGGVMGRTLLYIRLKSSPQTPSFYASNVN